MPKYQIKMHDMPYDFNSLEPNISQETIYYNHVITEQYYQELKKIIDSHAKINHEFPEHQLGSLNTLVCNYNKIKDDCKKDGGDKSLCNDKKLQGNIRQFAGGLINQKFWFSILKINSAFNPESEIGKLIISTFGSFKSFKQNLITASLSIFGSGWAWLVIDNNNNLRIYKTFNHDNPWFLQMTPLIAINVWEHAYFLQYKNVPKAYLEKIIEVINWEKVETYYLEHLKNKQ